MTTPSGSEFSANSAAGSRLLGTNALQSVVDKLTTAVDKLASVASSMASSGPGGTTTSSFGSTGQTFTSGSFPRMAPAAAAFGGGGTRYATSGGPAGPGGNPAASLPAAGSAMLSTGMAGLTPSGSQFGNMITMNQYAAMSTLGMGPGANMAQGMRAMYNQAFGSYGSGLNAVALNAADAAQGYSNLQGIAASPYVMSTAQGRAGYGAYAGFGVANPSLGAAGSSAAAAQLYSGQTSMAMRQLGYAGTPRASNGQINPMQMGQVMQSMMQRWYGKTSVSQGTLNAGLANNGKLQLNLQALGLDPSTMGPALQTYNKLFSQGLSASQAQTMLNDAAQNKNYGNQGSAQKLLSNKYGIPTSDLQKLKDTTANQTSTTSGEMSGFDSAISQATTSVQKFDTVLNSILKVTGLGTAMGAAHGMTGALGAVGGTFGSLVGKGMGMITGILGGAGGITPGGGSISAGGVANGSGRAGSTTSSPSKLVSTAIKDAESQVGRPYVWGGASPSTGFDCSGLVEWAYSQAGIKLPRTSQAQWAALQNRSVPLDKVQAGDIVFAAGSDGTATAPGHEAMMISNKQIVEAPYTGANIRIRAYNEGEWQHAGRPSGSMNGGTSGSNGTGNPSSTTGTGNSGSGSGAGGLGLAVGNYGSSSELSNVASALLGGIAGGSGGANLGGMGSVGNGQGSGSATSARGPSGASAQQAMAIAKKLAASYGWASGTQWNDLVQLWTDESSWNYKAENASGAYGIPQALPGSKMASAGSDWRTNPTTQIKWGLGYIKQRWQSPAGALANENAVHWYGDGTDSAGHGLALVGERGPELVHLSGGQGVSNAAQTRNILTGKQAKPAQAPWTAQAIQSLYLAPAPQNDGHSRSSGHSVNLNMPAGAIVIHANGTATDVSNSVRQIMAGIREAMVEDDMIQKIMHGVMG